MGDFFNDKLEPFIGIDMGPDPDVGDYEVEIDPTDTEESSCGFKPVVRPVDGAQVNGIGLTVGHVHVVVEPYGVSTAPDADDVMPTIDDGLGGGAIALDNDPPPRVDLEAGEWEAWILVQHREGDGLSNARCVFRTRGEGAPTVLPDRKRDEVAYLLCEFEVSREGDGVHAIEEIFYQRICNDLIHSVKYHAWKLVKLTDTTFRCLGGYFNYPAGTQQPIIYTPVFVPDANFTATGSGSINVQADWYTETYSIEKDLLVHPSGGVGDDAIYATLTKRKVAAVSSGVIIQNGLPDPGDDAEAIYSDNVGRVYWEVARYILEGGEVQFTDQLCNDALFMGGMEEAELTLSNTPAEEPS